MSWDFPDLKNSHSSSHYGVAMNFLEEALESMNDQINSQTNFEEQIDVRSSDEEVLMIWKKMLRKKL
jgi:predicted ATP-dependent Lon-type protease